MTGKEDGEGWAAGNATAMLPSERGAKKGGGGVPTFGSGRGGSPGRHRGPGGAGGLSGKAWQGAADVGTDGASYEPDKLGPAATTENVRGWRLWSNRASWQLPMPPSPPGNIPGSDNLPGSDNFPGSDDFPERRYEK